MLRKADQAFLKFQKNILSIQNYRCQFCGFQSMHLQEIVNIDGNYLNNRRSNLATACLLCAQCFFLESIGQSDFGGGSLVFLPEISQGQLNALCHLLFAQMANSSLMNASAKSIYRSLKLRSQLIEKQLGEGLSNPSTYGRALVENQSQKSDQLHLKIIAQLRLLPAVTPFSQTIQNWSFDAIDSML